MFSLGEIKKGKEIGKVGKYTKFIWQACSGCGKQRWVRLKFGKPASFKCPTCNRWTGGRRKRNDGYIEVWLYPDNPLGSMANIGGYVLEHRLIMAQYLGRPLLKSEIVHHKNGIKDDNRIENLDLMPAPRNHPNNHIWRKPPKSSQSAKKLG